MAVGFPALTKATNKLRYLRNDLQLCTGTHLTTEEESSDEACAIHQLSLFVKIKPVYHIVILTKKTNIWIQISCKQQCDFVFQAQIQTILSKTKTAVSCWKWEAHYSFSFPSLFSQTIQEFRFVIFGTHFSIICYLLTIYRPWNQNVGSMFCKSNSVRK